MGPGFEEPYDPRCRSWYKITMQNSGNIYHKPYLDFFIKRVIMTGSSQINDQNGDIISVMGIDFGIKNLIDSIFKNQDGETTSKNLKAHSVLFHIDNNTVFHHKDWDSSDGILKQWQELEFNSTIQPYKEEEKQSFIKQLEQSINYSLNGQFDIYKFKNTTPFYSFWTKNDEPLQFLQLFKFHRSKIFEYSSTFSFKIKKFSLKYYNKLDFHQIKLLKKVLIYSILLKYQNISMSLIYPIEIIEPHNSWNKTISRKQVLMIGKVKKDITSIFSVLNLSNNKTYAVILSIQTIFVLVIIIVLAYNFANVLKKQIELPIGQLISFLLQNSEQNRQFIINDDKNKIKLLNYNIETINKQIVPNNLILDKQTSIQRAGIILLSHEDLIMSSKESLNEVKGLIQEKRYSISTEEQNTKLKVQNSNKFQIQVKQGNNYFSNMFSRSSRKTTHSISQMNSNCQMSYNKKNTIDFTNNQQGTLNSVKLQRVDSSQYQLQKNKKLNIEKVETDQLLQSSFNSMSSPRKNKNNSQQRKINAEQDIEPMFQEMGIIIETFQQLGNVISFKKKDINYNQQLSSYDEEIDESSCILHYAFASKIFKQIKNNFGLAFSSLNLGYFLYKRSDYVETIKYYENALHHSLNELGFNNLSLFIQSLNKGQLKLKISYCGVSEQIHIILLNLILQSHTIKEIIFDRKDLIKDKKIFQYFFENKQRKKWIDRSLSYINISRDLALKFDKLGNKLFEDDSMIIIESEYIEMVMESRSINELQNLLENLEKNFIQLKEQNKLISSPGQKSIFYRAFENINLNEDSCLQLYNQDIIYILIQGKLKFLNGLLEQKKQNFKSACQYFADCLEQHFYLEQSLQKKCIENIGLILADNCISNRILYKEFKQQQQTQNKKVYDIAILVEGSLGVSETFKKNVYSTLLQMYKTFIRKQDRTTFIVFQNQKIRIVQPLMPIDKIKQWELCLESIQTISKNITTDGLNFENNDEQIFNQQTNKKQIDPALFQQYQKFVNLQFEQNQKNKQYDQSFRQILYIIFTNTHELNSSFKINMKKLIANLKHQYPSNPQILHINLNKQKENVINEGIIRDILNDSPYIAMSELNTLQYYFNVHKRQDNSQFFFTNLLLTQSNI